MPRLITKVLHANEFWVFLVIAALSLVIQARSGQFFTANNLVDLAGAMVVPGLFAVAAHLVLVSGGIDVSFPALASLAVYVTTRVLVDNGWNGPVIVPVLIAAGLGALLGAFNGVFTSRLTVPTLIITLGTANVFNGVMQGALKSVQINTIPASMRSFGSSSLFVARNDTSGLQSSMPVSFLILVAVVQDLSLGGEARDALGAVIVALEELLGDDLVGLTRHLMAGQLGGFLRRGPRLQCGCALLEAFDRLFARFRHRGQDLCAQRPDGRSERV